jgi:hypothetical protein
MKSSSLAFLGTLALAFNAFAGDTPAPQGANAYIVAPKHGEVVSSPIKVVFGLSGLRVAPAGVQREKTGHHHLLIDTGVPDPSKPIPADDRHKHFGGGQTETIIELTPGQHTLQLLLGDFAHIPHSPPTKSEQITVIVKFVVQFNKSGTVDATHSSQYVVSVNSTGNDFEKMS